MKVSKKAKKELIEASRSASLRKDMREIASNRHNPFFKNGKVDADGYIEFVTQFNEFINHAAKPFRPMIDKICKIWRFNLHIFCLHIFCRIYSGVNISKSLSNSSRE